MDSWQLFFKMKCRDSPQQPQVRPLVCEFAPVPVPFLTSLHNAALSTGRTLKALSWNHGRLRFGGLFEGQVDRPRVCGFFFSNN